MKQISDQGLSSWNSEELKKHTSKWTQALCDLGVSEENASKGCSDIKAAIKHCLDDSTARWILENHQSAESEYSLSYLEEGVAKKIIIDRTFVDDKGNRWIIDYKTATPEDAQEASTNHKEQLLKYASIFKQLDKRPIKLALYFPFTREFQEINPMADSYNPA